MEALIKNGGGQKDVMKNRYKKNCVEINLLLKSYTSLLGFFYNLKCFKKLIKNYVGIPNK